MLKTRTFETIPDVYSNNFICNKLSKTLAWMQIRKSKSINRIYHLPFKIHYSINNTKIAIQIINGTQAEHISFRLVKK